MSSHMLASILCFSSAHLPLHHNKKKTKKTKEPTGTVTSLSGATESGGRRIYKSFSDLLLRNHINIFDRWVGGWRHCRNHGVARSLVNTLTNDNVERRLVRFRKCVKICEMTGLYMIAGNKNVFCHFQNVPLESKELQS